MSTSQLFYLEITSDMANLERVADFVADVAKKSNLTEKQSDHVQMAVDEAVTNVMEHAYAGRTDGRIRIKVRTDAREFFVEIRDNGAPFDAKKVKKPNIQSPLSTRSVGGLGVFFMRKLMDKVEFTRDAAGNITRMTKKLK
ncbi:MAG: ATP-binding protein [Chloroflexi bacterium]|nr:ATP-binding protein [Chloroflexota bacterium]